MPRAISAFSSAVITTESFAPLMRRLQAKPEDRGWKIDRGGRWIYVQVNSEDLVGQPGSELEEISGLLEGPVQSSVVFVFNDDLGDDVEFRMAQATMRAMAEIWPVVLDDHASVRRRMEPPGGADPNNGR